MSVGKPMSAKTKRIVGHALENAMNGRIVGVTESDTGTAFDIKVEQKVKITIPDR